MILKNIIKHFILITHHKWVVFKLCCKIGEPWRGFVHDFSKYSPTEFFESVKYFSGNHSPIREAKQENGYSEAWLHHKGRNKHHVDYWMDVTAPDVTPVIPYKYAAEMICDKLAAGMIYKGKEFTIDYESKYWSREKKVLPINPKIVDFTDAVMEKLKEEGIKKGLTKKNLKNLYKKYCES